MSTDDRRSERPASGQQLLTRQEVGRQRLLHTAAEMFAEVGYRATTTKDISQRAGVAEPTLFRNFGSKAELFEAAMVSAFSEFVDHWIAVGSELPVDAPLDAVVASWVEALFDLIEHNRGLLRVLIAARFDGDPTLGPVADRVSAHFAAGLGRFREGAIAERARGQGIIDPAATAAAEVSMVMGTVLLSDWVLPRGNNPLSRSRLTREITAMILHGIGHRPSGS